jgi:hypothetical protein
MARKTKPPKSVDGEYTMTQINAIAAAVQACGGKEKFKEQFKSMNDLIKKVGSPERVKLILDMMN